MTDQISYYLIDDVSVIPTDLDADAGSDTWVEQGKKRDIGRVGDTTAMGLDCKWYHKGMLIDSGAVISVNANATKGAVDTYVVVQTICGLEKRDTVLVKTVGLGVQEFGFGDHFSIFPNPSNGIVSVTAESSPKGSIRASIYDLLGRMLMHEPVEFSNKQASIKLNLPEGIYILELRDEAGNVQRERITLR
ncbi:MAG: T9SS type A sorting domain-containing protein [Chitinophagaceae bacterium]